MRHVGDAAAGGEGAALIEIAVEADDLVARLQQHGHHDRSDIAKMSGNQHAHRSFSFGSLRFGELRASLEVADTRSGDLQSCGCVDGAGNLIRPSG